MKYTVYIQVFGENNFFILVIDNSLVTANFFEDLT